MISKEMILERKQTLVNDIDKLEKTIAEVGKHQTQLQSNMFALHGAVQQCDMFLEQIEKENEENG